MFTYRVDEEIELKLLELQDRKELFDVVDRNWDFLQTWLSWGEKPATPDFYLELIPRWLSQFAENRGFHTGIIHQGRLVGAIGLYQINWSSRSASIGYWLAEDAQGKGIITRCVRAILAIAFERYRLIRVEIRAAEENRKSRAIPERLGFRLEGVLQAALPLHGDYLPVVVYGMTAEDYERLKAEGRL
jgi:ribosomal-protein-serine acetyltransferase